MKFIAGRDLLIVAVVSLVVAGCGKSEQAVPPPLPEVGVVRAEAQSLPLIRNAVGRLSAVRSADVRARVAGVLLKRVYTEGSDVKEGQPLFQIDPAPLRAAYNAALAALAQAEANATNSRVQAERSREVAARGVISRADLDTAEAAERSTAAQVKQARANVETARINLSYATVRAPISGRAGQQRVTEGALVGEGEATLLTVVEQIDPIYVNFDQSAQDIDRLRRSQATGAVSLVEGHKADVLLLRPDGSEYANKGTLDFQDVNVDPTTGSLALRAVVPNADRQLLPGMFINVRLRVGVQNKAFRVPPGALRRDARGAFVLVVDAESKLTQKRVVADSLIDGDWVVTEGIVEGDQLVMDGANNTRPGSQVKAVPYKAPTA